MKKEKLQPNKVEATLFVGLGGIGSRIIKGVRDRCVNDSLENVQFVTMDTDVNDLERLENGPSIVTIQTSSSRSVAAYLRNDEVARNEWFPENKILDGKTVSEGAGQVRAISRLALNATIKQGKIAALYKAIDSLYMKNGSDRNRAVKVIIASTSTGGTGSGITLPVAMLIRQYLKKNYPESAAIIRGFIVMPSVMDTVIDSESERKSQRRNGYATIKEINAFMMKASGAFDYEPRLKRYSDLHITVPTTSSGNEHLSNLPFDFCFLLERTDSNQRNMGTLKQYEDYAAQCIYEQNIGPMKASANSKEDNIIKEFSNPQKHGRCRFGGAGASIIRYPYEEIRDYIALDWAQNSILGISSAKEMSEEAREAAIAKSWLAYDHKFDKELKKWQSDPLSSDEPPKLRKRYVELIESGTDDFTATLKRDYLNGKIAALIKKVETVGDDGDPFVAGMAAVAEEYFEFVSTRAKNIVGSNLLLSEDDTITIKDKMDEFGDTITAGQGQFVSTYADIDNISKFIDHQGEIKKMVENFIKSLFDSEDIIGKNLDNYRLGSFLSCGKKAMHPNAARYMLYKLLEHLKEAAKENGTITRADFDSSNKEITNPTSAEAIKKFRILLAGGNEQSLFDMCMSCDSLEGITEKINPDAFSNCRKLLNSYYDNVYTAYTRLVNSVIISVAEKRIEDLCECYEKFYETFSSKVTGIEKTREDIVGRITNKTGNCVYNLFGTPALLDTLARKANPAKSDGANDQLFADIFHAMRQNTAIAEANRYDEFSTEVAIDVFEDVILANYKKSVEEICDTIIDKDILEAMKLEYEISCDIKIAGTDDEEKKNHFKALKNKTDEVFSYIVKLMRKGKNLASPSISKNDFDEEREVSAVAFSTHLKDFAGIKVSDLLEAKNASDSISKRELHFFRSIYGLTPIQLTKLCSPTMDADELAKCVDIASVDSNVEIGDYFVAYQEYMESIGPDCKLNALITPHIDKSWNSISVMPELDLDYQTHLMQDIHQSLFYGFLFDIIQKYQPSTYDPLTSVYRYYDEKNDPKTFTVSNGTMCDKFDEVLDSLYFDRAAVKSIKCIAHRIRENDKRNRVPFEQSAFNKALTALSRSKILGKLEGDNVELLEKTPTSIFEIPMMYYNSLMISEDIDEIRAMTEAIINAMEYQLSAKEKSADVKAHLAQILVAHHNLLIENYHKLGDFLSMGVDISSNDAMIAIHKCIKKIVDGILQNGNDLCELNSRF